MRFLPLALLALVALSASGHADVRVVAPSGAPYAEIQAAVDAANDGDVVVVHAGTYASFVVRNQEVAIVADPIGFVYVTGAIRVSGVGATRTVLLSGLQASGSLSGSSSTKHGLFARNCAGALRVFGCALEGKPLGFDVGLCNDGQGAWVENCSDVVFSGCTLTGSSAFSGAPTQDRADGGHGAYASGSNLALYDTELRGGRAEWIDGYALGCDPLPNGGSLSGYGWGEAGYGARAEGCFVFASHVTFAGGPGRNSLCVPNVMCASCAKSGGIGLWSDHGSANTLLLDATLSGGPGGVSTPQCPVGIVGYACASCCAGGTSPCTAPSGAPSAGAFTAIPGASRALTCARIAREAQTVTLTYTGQPGDRVELLVGERTTFQMSPATRGVNVVKRARPSPIRLVGTIGGSGTLTETWTIPDLGAGVQSQKLYMQALMTDTSGQATLSSPVAIVLVDAAY